MVTSLLLPSYKAGFARNAAESVNPHLWRGLVGAWVPALGVTGNTLHDISAFKNHGILTNMDAGTDWIVSKGRLALDIDGSDDYVDCGGNPNLDLTGAMSVVTLIKWDGGGSDTTQNVVAKIHVSGNPFGYQLNVIRDSSQVRFTTYNNDIPADRAISSITANELTSIAAVYDGITITSIYKNGNFIDDGVVTGLASSTSPLTIGGRPSGDVFNGIVYLVLLFNHTLTPNEIRQLHIDPLALFRQRHSARHFEGRSISRFIVSAFRPETADVYLALLTLSHDDIDPSIRVVNNTQNIISNSNTFIGFPFDVTLPDSTGDSPPRFKLVIDNVTREIAQQIRLISSPLTITLEIVRAADPDTLEKQYAPFTLRNVKWDFLKMQGDLVVENMLTEPYPGGEFSPAFFPGGF